MPAHIETSREDSSIEASSRDDLSFWTNRHLKFRVLILGRANAGKTTILERVAGAAISEAKVRRDGITLPDQMIKGQSERGLHNVEDEIYFHSRPGFIFHDSRGVEAGSAEELSTVQQFVENRLSTMDLRNQLHAICFSLVEGSDLCSDNHTAPLVVIFTKRDGAVVKQTSWIIDQLTKDQPEITVTRSMKKEAREKADLDVTAHVNKLEGELRHFSLPNDAVAFLTTSGMEACTVDTDNACKQLINLTEESLTGPRIKTLLSASKGIKLGLDKPDTHRMIASIVEDMFCPIYASLDRASAGSLDHASAGSLDRASADHQTTHLQDLLSPLFHEYNPSLNDTEVLTLTALVLVVMHAVQTEVTTTSSYWITAIKSFLEHHAGPVQEKFLSIHSQIAVIMEEIKKSRNILTRIRHASVWRFSLQEAEVFAKQLAQCVEENLL
ncbi:hypothetical protein C8R44DRAFT_807119 [Mycena epipterygia]|nr:hypothetical protein C8R44DRAFT_807119 [Mycena epipterygia]